MRILITAGATREPIDAVRFISNFSTGATGAALGRALAGLGHEVVVLRGKGGVMPKDVSETESFSSASDLRARLERRLSAGSFDAVIMAAAVSDYRPEGARTDKIPSTAENLQLSLVRNEKILPLLRSMATGALTVIGFKLTVGADAAARRRAVQVVFRTGGVDAVVHNDLEEIRNAAAHPFRLFDRRPEGSTLPADGDAIAGTDALAARLSDFISQARLQAGQARQQ